MKAQNVVVSCAVVYNRQRLSAGIIVKMQGITAVGHMSQLTAVVGIIIGCTAGSALCAHTTHIIGKCPGGATFAHCGKLPPLCPGIVPCAIGCEVAYGVVGEGLAVVGCEQIAPLRISVTIGNGADNRTQCAGGVGIFLFA